MVYDNFNGNDFTDLDNDEYSEDAEWNEFSWNKYNQTLFDYGEPTDWDLFIERG